VVIIPAAKPVYQTAKPVYQTSNLYDHPESASKPQAANFGGHPYYTGKKENFLSPIFCDKLFLQIFHNYFDGGQKFKKS